MQQSCFTCLKSSCRKIQAYTLVGMDSPALAAAVPYLVKATQMSLKGPQSTKQGPTVSGHNFVVVVVQKLPTFHCFYAGRNFSPSHPHCVQSVCCLARAEVSGWGGQTGGGPGGPAPWSVPVQLCCVLNPVTASPPPTLPNHPPIQVQQLLWLESSFPSPSHPPAYLKFSQSHPSTVGYHACSHSLCCVWTSYTHPTPPSPKKEAEKKTSKKRLIN